MTFFEFSLTFLKTMNVFEIYMMDYSRIKITFNK